MRVTHLRKFLADATPGDWDARVNANSTSAYACGPVHDLPEFADTLNDIDFQAVASKLSQKAGDDARLICVMKRHFEKLLDIVELLGQDQDGRPLYGQLLKELEDL